MGSEGQEKDRVVGLKQTRKAVQSGAAVKVYVAEDAEKHVVEPLVALCREKGVEILWMESMERLAALCGVNVPTAAAADIA